MRSGAGHCARKNGSADAWTTLSYAICRARETISDRVKMERNS